MYIVIVDTKEDWGHYTILTDEFGTVEDFPDYESSEKRFLESRLADYFSVRYVNMDE